MPKTAATNLRKCPFAHCYAPNVQCNLGFKLNECPYWSESNAAEESDQRASPVDVPMPWEGAALGVDDLSFVTARSAPRVFGVIGPHDAGKTTLLVAWYLLINRGMRLSDRLFAGSCSFGGWENLAHWLRWPPGCGPSFPPHTSLHDKRQPGLLHLAFRTGNGMLEDVLLTDAPGEWFARWAVDRYDSAAEGARWTVQFANAFILVIDCKALAGPKRGIARSQLYDIAQRLADEKASRPVVIVWAKSDENVDAAMRTAVRDRLSDKLPQSPHFAVTIKNSDTPAVANALLAPLAALLKNHPALPRPIPLLPSMEQSDAFLTYRG